MEEEVEENINKYLEEGDYVWYKERFENQDNIFELFSFSDFYIMMHKVSVFDLSTLQAMSYGCIPFLSDAGGNKELCGFENGILAKGEKLEFDVSGYLRNGEWDRNLMEQMKRKNSSIIKEKFTNRLFLQRYQTILEGMG